ncbi:MAG TPA: protein kinase [Aggregatilineales bacterium]|nr:protein kinase [Aggregatilineales bacterium]
MVQIVGNRYELAEKIGAGGMGVVYRGRDTLTGQPVAIKELRADVIQDSPELIARFTREGEILGTLKHANIVRMLAMFEDGDKQYMVMEFIAGGSLADLMSQPKRLELARVLNIALDLADALTRTHRLNILHRDLKPGNVLIAEDGTPRLTDFGVARWGNSALTPESQLLGTLGYQSPEALNGESLDERSDLWAFGVMLFEMLTGKHPFPAEHFGAQVTATLFNPVPDLEALCPDFPVALIDLVYRMLEKDRHQRISSARLVGAELEAILHGAPSPGSLSAPSRTDPEIFADGQVPTTTTRNNLPEQATTFVGREAELHELAALLDKPSARMVGILGPGGMGKTRLALEVALRQLQHFKDGVYFVGLASVPDPTLMVGAIAEAIGFQFSSGDTPKNQLLTFLNDKHILLVLDNFEHLIQGADLIVELLQAVRHLKVIVTSRERLNIQWETVVRIEGMDFPDWETPQDAAEYSAVKLFLQSARRSNPSFELTADNLTNLARICRQVRGIPLGIVLAAAWVDSLSLSDISTEIERSFDFLESELHDLPERHRSMRAVFEYSWNLLTDAERAVLKGLAVFRDGFTREAAQSVADASLKTLNSLVNKSLVQRNPTSGRYDTHELLRQFVLDKTVPSAPTQVQIVDRHCDYYIGLLQRSGPDLLHSKQMEAVAVLKPDFENVAEAWRQFVTRPEPAAVKDMAFYLFRVCDLSGQNLRGMFLFEFAAEHLHRATNQRELWGTMLGYQAVCSLHGPDLLAEPLAFEAVTILEQFPPSWALVLVLCALGFVPEHRPLLKRGLDLGETLGADWLQAWAIHPFPIMAFYTGNFEALQRYDQKMLELLNRIDDSSVLVLLEHAIGVSFMLQERVNDAGAHFQRGLEIGMLLNNPRSNALGYDGLSWFASKQGDHANHKRYLLLALDSFRDAGDRWDTARTLGNLGHPMVRLGEYQAAQRYSLECLALAQKLNNPYLSLKAIVGYADALNHSGQAEHAVELLGFARNHSAVIDELKGFIDMYLKESPLSPEISAAAYERGRSMDFENVTAQLLANSEVGRNQLARMG